VATYIISAVRTGPVAVPVVHQHIEAVKLTSGTVFTRSQVIAMIRVNGDTFVTNANPPGRVYVHPCPHCRYHDYITTHPDYTATNNLLHLPRF
jgi:Protein of unknown function (DUF3892)